MNYRKRLPDGTLGEFEKIVGSDPSPEEQVERLQAEKEELRKQLMQTNADITDFMDFVLANLPAPPV